MTRRGTRGGVGMAEGIAGALLLLSFFGTLALSKSIIVSCIAAGFVLAGLFAIVMLVRQEREDRLGRSEMADIDRMDSWQFAYYAGRLFQSHGYAVSVMKTDGDDGASLIVAKDGRKTVIQAKPYSNGIGVRAVREAQAAIARHGAADVWVVASSACTEDADADADTLTLAKSNNVRVVNRKQLIGMI